MKLYNVLIKKTNAGKIEDVILLKDGFSFSAFLFSGLWFLYHRMWREFFALGIMNIAFVILGEIWSASDRTLLELAFLIIVALNANYWFCEYLIKKNYEFIGLVFGENLEEAKFHFIENMKTTCGADLSEFDDSILDPKLHHKMLKSKKSKPQLAL